MERLLSEARHEIIRLRRDNEILSAQMAVIEVFAAALGLRKNSQAMSIDIAWELERKIEELATTKTPAPNPVRATD
jgi:hypothetical protein